LGKLRLVVGVLGSVVEVVAVGWLLLLLGGLCYFVLEDMLCAEDMLSVEMARAVDDWLWHSGRLIVCRRLGYFGKLVVERAKDMIENIADSEGPIVWYG
jgi:hypothetical protein